MASIWKPPNSKNYWISYYVKGKQVKHSLKTSNKAAALEYKAEIETRLIRGELGRATGKELSAFFQEYLDYSKSKKALRSYMRDKRIIKVFNQFLDAQGINDISEIDNRTLERYMSWRKSQVMASTVNREMNTVLNMFTLAQKWKYIDTAPKASKFKIAEMAEYRFLSFEEIDTLLREAKGHRLYPIIATAYCAGLRTSEIINLRWEDIHFDSGYISVVNRKEFTTKSYRNRNVPLANKLRAILEEIRKNHGLCFPNSHGKKYTLKNLDKIFKRVSYSCGIPCLLKDLRETFGSHLAIKGTSLYKISRWLGHSSIKITENHYAHLQKADEEINL